jgi:hypothetical protein
MIASGWGFPSPRICGPRKQSRLIGGLGDVRGGFESARAPLADDACHAPLKLSYASRVAGGPPFRK